MVASAKTILNELSAFDETLLDKPRWLILNKIDRLADDDARQETIKHIIDGLQWKGPVYPISAIRSEGTKQLCYSLMELIDEMKLSDGA